MRMQGAVINGEKHYEDVFRVSEDVNGSLDTLTGNNCQLLLLLNDEPLDLSAVQPMFETFDLEAEVYSEQTGGSTPLKGDGTDPVQDHSGEKPVQYSVRGNKGTANYFVTFAQKDNGGPKLFVNSMLDEDGNPEREVFIVDHYNNEHNVLVANLGSEPLKNVKAELIGCTPNIQLDDYWTLNGDNIALFTSVDKRYDANNEYKGNGYLLNLAKVRIVSAGSGPINGTLRISADGQEPIDIHLTGTASNPQILTAPVLDEGIKDAPYSHTILTDNAWGSEDDTFSLLSGTLPKGVTLNEATGEISGVPQELGTYTFTVRVNFARSDLFNPVEKEFTLTVRENTTPAGGSSSDSGSASSAPAANVPQSATLTLRVTDANGNGLPGMTVELHSTPRTAVTDANGYVTFYDVPFGAHTIYVKNAGGQVLASRSFVFGGSTAIGVSGDSVQVLPGGTINLTARLNGNAISFVSAIPQTADPFDPARWAAVLVLSAGALALLAVYKKRRSHID